MPYQKFTLKPGVYKDDSPLQAEGYWIDVNKIRFVRGLPETIYGWERASTSTLLGIARGAITWADNTGVKYAAFGTHLRQYAMDADGNVTDITPGITYARTAVSLTTVSATNAVTLNWDAHNLVADQKFTLANPTVTTVGGVTVAGTFVVSSTVNTSNLIYTAASVASSSAGPTSSTCDTIVYLAPGQVDGLGGLGFGTGGFGSGGYASATSGYTLYPRTVSFAQWGQNITFNPRGGGIYEWAPNVMASELITNGTFTGSATGWTLGSGWTYSANTVVANGSIGAMSQTGVLLPVGAWCKLQVDTSAYSAGTLQMSVGGTNIGTAISSATTTYIPFFSGSGGAKTVIATAATTLGVTVDNLSLQVLTYGNIITNAPTAVTCIFTTAERILVACGCADTNGNFDAMRVRWTDQQNNQTWTALPSNLAGSYTLSNGSRIVRGLAGNRENIILTDTALYAMRYVTDPNVVYSFNEIASGCGLIGPNAGCQVGGIFYWMDNSGGFWQYDGSYPRPLMCTLGRDVKDNLAWVQQDKIYAFALTVKGRLEVWWLVPDLRDGTECSRYVGYAITESNEQQAPVWFNGTFNRTSWVNSGVFEYPLAVDATGKIWFHEKGFTEDGAARSWSATSAQFDLGDGDGHMRIMGLQPDAEDLQGGYSITLNTYIQNSAGITSRTMGPYNITAMTGQVNIRASGQQASVTYSGNAAPTFWRKGADRIELQASQRTR